MSLRRLTLPTVLSLALLAPSRADAAAMYTVTNLGNFGPQSINAQGMVAGDVPFGVAVYSGYGPNAGRIVPIPDSYDARGINASGQVLSSAPTGSMIVSLDGATKLVSNSYVIAINDSGELVGTSLNGGVNYHAFAQNGTRLTDLGTLGGPSSGAFGVNAYGQVVGAADLPPNNPANPTYHESHAFLYSNGKMTDLGSLGGSSSSAVAINAAGQVAGTSVITGGDQVLGITRTDFMYNPSHAFLYTGGKMTDLGTLGGDYSAATALSSSGQVIGNSLVSGGYATSIQHAFLYSEGMLHDLNALIPPGLGWTLISASGINDAGQIVGEATDSSGKEFGYLLTPDGQVAPTPPATPEPASLAFFGVLAVGLGVRLVRRRRAD